MPDHMKGFVALTFASLLLASCGDSGKVKFSEEKYGVSASPRMVKGSKVPKGGGRSFVGKPYKVAGKWYKPKLDPNYKKVGLASWYGPTFHGRMTANGEIFDRNAITAAHTTMPLPSYARVTNTKNGRSIIVRVNDRGPFHGNRVIDLSERAATILGTKSAGIGRVKVEYVGRAPLHGNDEKYLLASYRGPGAVTPGASRPNTMIASARPSRPRVQVARANIPVPAARPYSTPASIQVASLGMAYAAPQSDPAYYYQRMQPVQRDPVQVAQIQGLNDQIGQLLQEQAVERVSYQPQRADSQRGYNPSPKPVWVQPTYAPMGAAPAYNLLPPATQQQGKVLPQVRPVSSYRAEKTQRANPLINIGGGRSLHSLVVPLPKSKPVW
ncbi:septal ring lytic transglycosylase RlpA family protein [Polycladidibacter stylochi]|uniref:septal ring lytic transglycosylase RlpA family protein n=1 Tax=Polycladidibacter stylochi TaxID=1807766 RepID=UPI0009E9927F|nr:septal ring lytic transglycosylase RlpA family protein [Pseudovibrio stylochi]